MKQLLGSAFVRSEELWRSRAIFITLQIILSLIQQMLKIENFVTSHFYTNLLSLPMSYLLTSLTGIKLIKANLITREYIR